MKKVLITGGTGSLGQALIKNFSEKKEYKIEFTYHNNDKLAMQISKRYKVKAIKLNQIDNILEDYDVVINSAGIINAFTNTENVNLNDWNEAININLTLPFLIIKKVLPHMKKQKWGRIINISSIYGIKAEEEILPYNVSKHGLIGLTKTVAKEYAKYGITCNAICPGTMESDMVEYVSKFYSKNEIEKKKYYKEMINKIPANRLAKPDEIAKIILFIASNATGYINGISLVVDGGSII
jgi:3-hydroxybutyrate dehydrogenase